MPEKGPVVRPTRLRTILLAALVGAGATFLVMAATSAYELTMPVVEWTTPILIASGAAAAAVLARVTHVRNHVVRQPQDPSRALTTLAIAKALLIGGGLLAGGYLAFALFSVGRLDASLPRERLAIGLVSAAASVAIVIAGWFLERACRTPRDDEDDSLDT